MSAQISVVIPVWNGAAFLADTVQSLHGLSLGEIIVIDDGSTDQTAQIAQGMKVRYYRQENLGPSAARNRAVELARGEYLAFLDADDRWAPGHPANALAQLERGGFDLVFGKTQCLTLAGGNSGGNSGANNQPAVFEPHQGAFHSFMVGSALCRRDLFARVGGFDETLREGEDADWFLRVRESGARIAALPQLALFYRLHGTNLTGTRRMARAGLMTALQHSLLRRRTTAATSLPDLTYLP